MSHTIEYLPRGLIPRTRSAWTKIIFPGGVPSGLFPTLAGWLDELCTPAVSWPAMKPPLDREAALRDIDEVLGFKTPTGGTGAVAAFVSRAVACIRRNAPSTSTYGQEAGKIMGPLSREDTLSNSRVSQIAWGLLTGLRADVDQGKLEQFQAIVHGEVFSDFLDQAENLLEANPDYRRAATVLAGGTLEEHMRKLAVKHAIGVVTGQGGPKKAAQLNTDL